MAHYCIGMPCWICYPEHAPKLNGDTYNLAPLQNDQISDSVKEFLVDVFESGIGEDAHFRALGDDLSLTSLKEERARIDSNSLAAKLLDLVIESFENDNQ